MPDSTRADLATLLRSCGVVTLRELGIEEQFVDGTADLAIEQLRMDSLSAMEFCIALEERWGLSVAPQEAASFGTLGHLAEILAGSHAE